MHACSLHMYTYCINGASDSALALVVLGYRFTCAFQSLRDILHPMLVLKTGTSYEFQLFFIYYKLEWQRKVRGTSVCMGVMYVHMII